METQEQAAFFCLYETRQLQPNKTTWRLKLYGPCEMTADICYLENYESQVRIRMIGYRICRYVDKESHKNGNIAPFLETLVQLNQKKTSPTETKKTSIVETNF